MTGTAGRKYCYSSNEVSDLAGVKAKIKTRYGTLCDEGSGTAAAFQVAYVNVSDNSGPVRWAQTGWGRERHAGSTAVVQYRYAEMKGNTYHVEYDTGNAPTDNSMHTYQCILDKSTGTWSFFLDETQWKQFQDDCWKNNLGTTIQWSGEIYNKEDMMPGTATNKCNYTDCQQRTSGGFVNANITRAISSDSTRWGAEIVSKTAINIWTKST